MCDEQDYIHILIAEDFFSQYEHSLDDIREWGILHFWISKAVGAFSSLLYGCCNYWLVTLMVK